MAAKVLPMVECCSDIEEDKDGVLQSKTVPWRSTPYNTLIAALDEHTVRFIQEFKGTAKAIKSVEYNKGRDDGKSKQQPCSSLPANCYCPNFLATLSKTERIALDIKPNWIEMETTTLAVAPDHIIQELWGEDEDED